MLISIRDLASKGNTVHFQEKVNLSGLLKERQDIVDFGPLEVDLQAQSVSGITRVEGHLNLPLELVCSRCLCPIKDNLTIPFREAFSQKSELIPQDELDDTHLVSEDKIELMPYVEESVWLALPYIALCSESCKGLCPDCGVNRNTEPCACKQEKLDPRLAGLADFFNK
jgi:uncharacterized protein